MNGTALVFRYGAFAIIAIIANLATQRVVLGIDDGALGFSVAVFLGTLVGLVLKYVLDKRWIFFDRSTGAAAHSRKFTLYTAMGVVTTAIFWGTETAFWILWKTDVMREFGAVIGLTIGYVIKYKLDKRFVFSGVSAARPA